MLSLLYLVVRALVGFLVGGGQRGLLSIGPPGARARRPSPWSGDSCRAELLRLPARRRCGDFGWVDRLPDERNRPRMTESDPHGPTPASSGRTPP